MTTSIYRSTLLVGGAMMLAASVVGCGKTGDVPDTATSTRTSTSSPTSTSSAASSATTTVSGGVTAGTSVPRESEAPVGAPNPASVYCEKTMGGVSENRKDAQGNEYGVCLLPDGRVVDEWELYRNK
ncbi:DUF333 domain-containing protein [Mycolicibacterium mucogenicum]|uniref:putative hemolysin n=1 Tax=Mycolicibacterium mucogenicum TaxID=56689 RepID=UPI000A4B1DD3|nr:DUF333 domain-containing protein [Mycolicibacterium mucogenicum]